MKLLYYSIYILFALVNLFSTLSYGHSDIFRRINNCALVQNLQECFYRCAIGHLLANCRIYIRFINKLSRRTEFLRSE